MNAAFVARTLLGLFAERGTPKYVRSDNGPEFIAKHLMRALAGSGVEARSHRAGEPVAERAERAVQREPAG